MVKGFASLSPLAWNSIKSCGAVTDKNINPFGSARENRNIVRAAKKSPLKSDKKSSALTGKRGGADYSKKAALLEDAITQMNAGKYGRSSAALKELLALDPLNLEARRLFATLHLRLCSLLPARQAFEALANEALERQDYWLAESLLREYLVAGPRCVPFIEKLGIVYQEKGDELAAAEEFGKAIDILLEDPESENPNKPTQLYAKIRELAPASPPAFRLAAFFDAQTGELLDRTVAAPTEVDAPQPSSPELIEPAESEALRDSPLMPEPIPDVAPWEPVGETEASASLPDHQSDGTDWPAPSSPSEGAPSQSEAEPEAGAALCSEYSPDSQTTELSAAAEPLPETGPEASWSYDVDGPHTAPETTADLVTAPMPWDQVQDVTVTIPHADASRGIETRSPSSVATESPFVSLSDTEPVEPNAGSVFAGATPDTASDTSDVVLEEARPEAASPSHSMPETGSTEEMGLSVAEQPADVPQSAFVESLPPSTISEPVQELPVDSSNYSRELVSSEPLPEDSLPRSENPPLSERAEAPKNTGFSWESIFSTWKYGPSSSAGKMPAQHVPVPDLYETSAPPLVVEPAAQAFVYEASQPTVDELPSSATPVMEIPPEPAVSAIVSEQACESPVATSPVESVEPHSHHAALDSSAASEAASAEAFQDVAPVLEQPEAVVNPSPVLAETIEPGSADLSSGIEFGVQGGDSAIGTAAEPAPVIEPPVETDLIFAVSAEEDESRENIRLAGAGPETVKSAEELQIVSASAVDDAVASVEEALSYEASSPRETSSDQPVQQEEFRYIASGEPVSLAVKSEAEIPEILNPVADRSMVPAHSEEFRVVSSSEAIAPAVTPEAELSEVSSHAVASPESPMPLEEFRTISSEKANDSVVMSEAEVFEVSNPVMANPEPARQPETLDAASSVETISSMMANAVEHSESLSPVSLSSTQLVQPEAPQVDALEVPADAVQETVGGQDQAVGSDVPPVDAQAVMPPAVIREALLDEVPPVHEPLKETTESAVAWDRSSAIELAPSPVASAVDALFQSSGRMARTETREQPPSSKPRPRVGGQLARLRLSVSAFIGSCFSTTQALIVSLVGLVVLICAMAAIAIGALGVTWVIMEEKPSLAFQRLTAAPQRSQMETRKNGYWLLLGFGADADADPIQVGYERKPGVNEDDAVSACLGGADGHSGGGPIKATASVAEGWFRSSHPVAQFKTKADGLKDWINQSQSSIGRYRQWLKMPFEDWGYGQGMAPPCAAILFAHRLYVAEGFESGQPTEVGIRRLQDDMEAWRLALGQAKTLPVKMLAVHAMQDDLAVASGLLTQPDFDTKNLPDLATMLRPLDQVESSMRWPMQSELMAASQATDAQLKRAYGDEGPWYVTMTKWLPLPKQRRLNEYAEYYDASAKAAGEGRYSAMPKRAASIKNPPATVMDYLTNPIENIVGLKPLPSWEQYNGMVIDTDARLRLASLQAWLRRGSQEGDLITRIAKAGQRFYDPYTGMPMLLNLKRGMIYSVGHDGKDQEADPEQDVVVSVPLKPASSGNSNASPGTAKSK